MLYEKASPATLVEAGAPTSSAQTSSTVSIANEHSVRLFVQYTAQGSGKALLLYPEISLGPGWFPALSAAIDTSGATVDAEGYLAASIAPPYLKIDGISGVTVAVCVDVPVPAGASFRVRYLEDSYSSGAPAEIYLFAQPSRGAS